MTQRERIAALEADVAALKAQNLDQHKLNESLTALICTVAKGGQAQLELVNNIADIVLQDGETAKGPVVANDPKPMH